MIFSIEEKVSMKHMGKTVEDLRIAYIGGGSRQWGRGLMSDLALADDISGTVSLYDIDRAAAEDNAIIGNSIDEGNSKWKYEVAESLKEVLTGADFVVISIQPGTFDEMESDVHVPEKYGIYQSVGDTSGPGGLIRALRAIPMFEEIAIAIKEYCPKAWVINYTNPMTLCTGTLYRVFPGIKAFGCCHEVFGTQRLLVDVLEEKMGIKDVKREDIKVNVIGVNHFTWLTSAQYKNIDLFPIYKEFVEEHYKEGYVKDWEIFKATGFVASKQMVKFDLFRRYGWIAAAGDRHLAEFCPGDWYLENNEKVQEWGFFLTPVSSRKDGLKTHYENTRKLISGEQKFKLNPTGEEGVKQIRAILGLEDLCTNVNLPNVGQIPNLPKGAIVETNAQFTANSVHPVMAGEIPENILSLIGKIAAQQEMIKTAALNRDLDMAFSAFASDPLVRLPIDEAKKLFDEMIENTKAYLTSYNI